MTSGPSAFDPVHDDLPSGRLTIEASAGTGKTYTLAALATRLIADRGVRTNELLVVTFTRAAAAELRDRVRTRVERAASALRTPPGPELLDPLDRVLGAGDAETRRLRLERLEEAIVEFDAATITTIHGFAQQMLATLGTAAIDADAVLAQDADVLIGAVVADELTRAAFADPDGIGLLPKGSTLKSRVRCALANPGVLLEPPTEIEAKATKGVRRAEVMRRLVDRAIAEVHRRHRLAGTRSFDEVLTTLRDAIRDDPAAGERLRLRFRAALIDEFQDTDPVQWEIFASLFPSGDPHRSLVLVGDPKQAIYGFRGADIHAYLASAHAPDAARVTLATNHRSDAAVLEATARVFAGATFGDPRIEYIPVRAAPGHERTRLLDHDGQPREALHVRAMVGTGLERDDDGSRPRGATGEIARDLAGYVHQLLAQAYLPERRDRQARAVRPADVAVLVGTHVEAATMQQALRDRGIPAVTTRGRNVFRTPAATHWRWLLAALAEPSHIGLARTAALTWFGGWSAEGLDDASDEELARVQEQLHEWRAALAHFGTAGLWTRIRSESGVVGRVLAAPDGDRQLTDLGHIAEVLHVAGGRSPATPSALLSAFDELRENDADVPDEVTARRTESDAEAVQIMTVFAAKGLEFPVVCVPTLWVRSRATSSETVYRHPEHGRRVLDVARGCNWPTGPAEKERRRLADAEAVGEHLRLLYVALTRAEHHTAIWWASADASDRTGLARVLFARGQDGIDPDAFEAERVPVPADDATVAFLERHVGDGDTVAITDVGPAVRAPATWSGDDATAGDDELVTAILGRRLDRGHRRWSFSAITARAHTEAVVGTDPDDESLGDAGAADEGGPDRSGRDSTRDATGGRTTDDGDRTLPLGALPAGARFGTLVHEVLERVDFTESDLDAALDAAIDEARLRSEPDLGVDARAALRAGLRAAIETPLGPLFHGCSLRDLPRSDRLDEVGFELHLGVAGHRPSDREIGALVAHHLATDDPLRPWAEGLAEGRFGVTLAGHLTGSIDAVFRVRDPHDADGPDRFVLADYKTNLLREPGRPADAHDYRPDALPAAMIAHDYPFQALLYAVALHRYLRWRLPGYDPAAHLGGAAYLFVRGMVGPDTPRIAGRPHGVFSWAVPDALVRDLSDLLHGVGRSS